MTPVPYYQDERVTLYNADCRDVLATTYDRSGLLLTDPPYGVNEKTNRGAKGRGIAPNSGSLAEAADFPPVYGDDKPFDPAHLLAYPRAILFGANYYADKLPVTPSWIVWDKLNGLSSMRSVGFNDNADCELAWTNLGGPARIFRHMWMGIIKESEIGQKRVHPTQKPVRLLRRIIDWRARAGERIVDLYAGSGSTVIAALEEGHTVMACEIVSEYCATIIKRIQQYYDGTREGDTPPPPRMRLP